ncbi:beta-N-acetylhexosaminidase [Cohnella panacarvi]|uniref:beta-N-acetylhexosaminidase n=1 Tax=Cohnella panacarvi TaxID=400776 RepID=UPI000479D208|nr:beta-N-acetylhexosaminidase [Cohnella panacarvi]
MKDMTLKEKIGQLIFTGFPSPFISGEMKRLISDYKIGNVILFAHNVENAGQLRSLCAELQKDIKGWTGHPALIAIDQEGGRVVRLPADATNVPGAMAIASTGKPEHAYAAGRLTALELRALGINFNLAPVLDINNNPRNPVINVRSYGDTAEVVEKFGVQMMKGLKGGGVLACVKHFPGHGDTEVDSHIGLPSIGKSLEELEQLELKPFRKAIAQGAECVMTSHILFPMLETEPVPATMSRAVITGLLKERLGFKGLVVSDCLEMDAIRKHYGTARGAVGALKAGVHMLFISHTPELVIEAVKAIEAAVRSGELPMEAIDEAVANVLAYKRKYESSVVDAEEMLDEVGSETHRLAASAMSKDSICLVRGKLEPIHAGDSGTLFLGVAPYRADLVSNATNKGSGFAETMGAAFAAAHETVPSNPGEAEWRSIAERARPYGRVVIGLYNAVDNPGQLALANRLAKNGHRVIAIALGKPYDLERLEGDVACLAAFEYTRLALSSLIAVLGGAAQANGKISLTKFGTFG